MSRYDLAAGHYIIAARWHSGQASKGYRKLCQAGRIVTLSEGAWQRGSEERQAAACILWARRHQVRRQW